MPKYSNLNQQLCSFIGNKIFQLRLAYGWSRKDLAKRIEVTQQQLQKYEKGTNNISVSRLYLIAQAFQKDIDFFYSGFDGKSTKIISQHMRMCLEVSRNFMNISHPDHQHLVNKLVKSMLEADVFLMSNICKECKKESTTNN